MKIGLPFNGDGPGGACSWIKNFTKYCRENGHKITYSFDSNVDIFVNIANFSPYEKLIDLKESGVKLVHRMDGIFLDYMMDKNLAQTLNQDLAMRILLADLIIYQSHFSKLLTRKLIPDREIPGVIIYNGADTTLFSPEGPILEKPKEKKVILSIAYWGTSLYSIDSLTIIRNIAREFINDSSIEFWVFGMTKPIIDGSFFSELPNVTRVDLTKPIERKEMPRYLRTADLILHTRSNEACSNLIIEAMNVGKPIVGLNSGSTPELLADAGLMGECESSLDSFPTVNILDVCDKIRQIFQSYSIYQEKIQMRSKLFTQKIMCEKYLKELEALLTTTVN